MNFREKLHNIDQFLIFDGAMGTMLQKNGLKAGDYPETLNFSHPELIKKFMQNIWMLVPILLFPIHLVPMH